MDTGVGCQFVIGIMLWEMSEQKLQAMIQVSVEYLELNSVVLSDISIR